MDQQPIYHQKKYIWYLISVLALFRLCSQSIPLNSSLCSTSRCLHSEFVIPFFNRNTAWSQCRQAAVFEPCLPVCHAIFLKCVQIREWLLLSAIDISEEDGWTAWDMLSNCRMTCSSFGLNLIYTRDQAWYDSRWVRDRVWFDSCDQTLWIILNISWLKPGLVCITWARSLC